MFFQKGIETMKRADLDALQIEPKVIRHSEGKAKGVIDKRSI